MNETPLVRIVDDDPSILNSLKFLLTYEGYEVQTYSDAESFFVSDSPSRPGCVILDVKLGGISGLFAHKEINRRAITLPVIFLTGHGDIDMAVQAMKDGAFDFLSKPIDAAKLLPAISSAIERSLNRLGIPRAIQDEISLYNSLSDREEYVLRKVASGLLNRQIAKLSGVSIRTVETQRLSGLKKIGVSKAAELAAFFGRIDSTQKKNNIV